MYKTFALVGAESTLSENYQPPIELDVNSEYSLALIGFYSYNNIPNIEEGTNKFYYLLPGSSEQKSITLPKGAYEITAIEQYLQKVLLNNTKRDTNDNLTTTNIISEQEKDKTFSLKANENTLKCEIFSSRYDINFKPEDSIGKLLGFSQKLLKANQVHQSDLPVNIIRVNTIRVECNIVKGSYYKSKESHTLYETGLDVGPAEQIFIEPVNPLYLPIINRLSIPNITLNIIDQDNRLIDFNGQTINIRLALKKHTSS